VLVLCFAAGQAHAAPATWQRNVTLGNGSTYQGRGQGGAVPSSPLIASTAAGLAGTDPEQVRVCAAGVLDPAKVAGKIVVCDNQGSSSPAEKGQAVAVAGGVGMILANVAPGPLVSDVLTVGTIHIDQTAGAATKAYIAGTAAPTASMSAGQRFFAASTTALASSANPSIAGKPVTVTATVGAGSLQPEGSVAFTGLGVPIAGCGSVAVAAGKASCTFSPLSPGAYSIEATYSGDDGLDPSSGALVQQVKPFTPPPTTVKSAISDLRLASRCARRSRAGRARVAMTMQLASPAALQIVVERAAGSKARRRCPSQEVGTPARFRPVTTLDRGVAPAGERRVRLRLRLRPGLYRVTVRAVLADESLSRPVRGFVRVLARGE
jgi:hypothetical protein